MATVVLWGATYSNVPAIDVPSSNSTTARFYDAEDGDEVEYGTGDSTRPIVGIGTVNSMVI